MKKIALISMLVLLLPLSASRSPVESTGFRDTLLI
jgi:hypothetical protein